MFCEINMEKRFSACAGRFLDILSSAMLSDCLENHCLSEYDYKGEGFRYAKSQNYPIYIS